MEQALGETFRLAEREDRAAFRSAGELEPEVAGAGGALAAGRLRVRFVPQVEVHLHAPLVRVVQIVPESAGGRGGRAQERLVVKGDAGVRLFHELRRQL